MRPEPVPISRTSGSGGGAGGGGGPRPTYLTLQDHGKVFVADLPRLSDGQLGNIAREAREVYDSLCRKITELEQRNGFSDQFQGDTLIRANTKRDVTARFLRAIQDEQARRRDNPQLQGAAGESLARCFMEIARHRLPGSTFDSLLQESLDMCSKGVSEVDDSGSEGTLPVVLPIEGLD